MDNQSVINTKCTECGKNRQAHYDNIYCYAASRLVHGTVYVFTIKEYQFTLSTKEN